MPDSKLESAFDNVYIELAVTLRKGCRWAPESKKPTEHKLADEVDIFQIFDNISEDSCQVFLVEGRLGSGKTSLAWHYCKEWAKDNLVKFDLVVFVELRKWAKDDPAEPIDILNKLLFLACEGENDSDRALVEAMAEHVKKEKLLLLLDGWDEMPSSSQDSFDLVKLCCSLSSNATILITSRPDSSAKLQKKVANLTRLEIVGFSEERIDEYFQETFSSQLTPSEAGFKMNVLSQHFSTYPDIKSCCYLPLNAFIIATMCLDSDRNELPKTHIELVDELVFSLANRELKCSCSYDDLRIRKDCKHGINHQDHLDRICNLAYDGIMKKKNNVFTEEEVQEFLQPTQCLLGVLLETTSLKNSVYYHFIHLSIQEFLAARHIFKLKDSEQASVIQALFEKVNTRFSTVLQFYAAFTRLTDPGVQEIITGTDFTRDESSQLSLLSYMRCIFEAKVHDQSFYRKIIQRMKGKIDLFAVSMDPFDCIAFGYFLAFVLMNTSDVHVVLHGCSIDDHSMCVLLDELSKQADLAPLESGLAPLWRITDFDVSNNKLGNIGIARISDALQTRLITSTTLQVYRCGILSLDAACARSLASTLHELNISSNMVDDTGIASIATALQTSTCSLRTLNISKNKISDAGIARIATAVQTSACTLTTLDISDTNISDTGITYIASALQTTTCTLRTLNISENEIGDSGIACIAIALETCNRTLTKLNVSSCNIMSLDEAFTKSLVSVLHQLDIRRNKIGETGIATIATALETNTCTLKTLDISDCDITNLNKACALSLVSVLHQLNISRNKIGDTGIASIATALATNTCTLTTLDISDCGMTNLDEACARSLVSVLQKLNMNENKIGYDGIACIATALKLNTGTCNLKTLNIPRCNITSLDEACALSLVSALHELDISWNEIGNAGLACIATALKTSTCTLTTLNIGGCDITTMDETCSKSLASALHKLDISWNEIDATGIGCIATSLENNITLEELYISGCGVTDDGAKSLARALTMDSKLKVLALFGNEIGDEGVSEIRTARKECLQDINVFYDNL